jgi:V/A-type H+-transporting ATPase subunit D
MDDVYRFFGGARASMTREEMISALAFPRETVEFDVSTRNVMSVRIPIFERRPAVARDTYGWLSTSGNLDLAIRRLGELLPSLVRLAEKEKAISLLSRDLEKTRQRVNALEHVLIPAIQETIKYISSRLAENERGAITRLMKIKDIIRK